MANPSIDITVAQGGGGAVPPSNKWLVVGASAAGTSDTLESGSSPAALQAIITDGPGFDCAARIMKKAKIEIDFLKTQTSTAASNTTLTASAGGPAITVSGAARNFYDVIIQITKAGGLGVAEFIYSLDGGKTYQTTPQLVPITTGVYVVPDTGLTWTFADFTFVLDEQYTGQSVPATANAADLSAAGTAAAASQTQWPVVVFAMQSASGSAAATVATAITSFLDTLVSANKFPMALIDVGDDTAANVVTAFSAHENWRVCRIFGKSRMLVAFPIAGFANPELPNVYAIAGRAAAQDVSTNPAWYELGALDVTEPSYDTKGVSTLHTNRINALTTHDGDGNKVYINSMLVASATSSLIKHFQDGRVVNEACRIAYAKLKRWLNATLATKTDGTGRIDDEEKSIIDNDVQNALDASLVKPINRRGTRGHVSGILFEVDATADFAGTEVLASYIQIVKKTNVSQITNTVALVQEI